MLADKITAGYAKGFDAERKALFGKRAKLLLLRSAGGTNAYRITATIEAGWVAEFSEYFGTTTFRVARADPAFNDAIRESDLLTVINSDNAALNNQLHEINGETTVPAGVDPFWRIRVRAKGGTYAP